MHEHVPNDTVLEQVFKLHVTYMAGMNCPVNFGVNVWSGKERSLIQPWHYSKCSSGLGTWTGSEDLPIEGEEGYLPYKRTDNRFVAVLTPLGSTGTIR